MFGWILGAIVVVLALLFGWNRWRSGDRTLDQAPGQPTGSTGSGDTRQGNVTDWRPSAGATGSAAGPMPISNKAAAPLSSVPAPGPVVAASTVDSRDTTAVAAGVVPMPDAVPEAIGAAGSLAVSSIGDEGGSDLVVTAGALTAADDSVASSGETAAGTGGPSSITVDAMGASVAESSLSGMATHDLTGVDVAGPGGMATVAMAAEDATSALYSTAEPTHELVSGAATMASDVAATADRSAMAADAAQAGSAVHAPEITISHDMAESSSVAPDATADEHAGLDAAAVAGTGVADESVGMGDSLVSAGGVAGVAAEMVGAPDAATSSAVPTMDAAPTGAAAASIDSLAEPISAGAPSVPDLEGSVGAYEDGKTNMSPYLDKAYEAWELGALLDAPVDALEGVSRSDAELLQRAFNIRTIRDMGANRYFRRAKSIVALAHPSDTHEGH